MCLKNPAPLSKSLGRNCKKSEVQKKTAAKLRKILLKQQKTLPVKGKVKII